MAPTSAFHTPQGEAAYLASYKIAMQSWPVPYEEIEVPSRFGTTHVVTSGPHDAPALVLLHGFMATLTMWSPNIEDLSKAHRVYAIDTMGHPSRSVPDEPIRSAADYVEWLDATFEGLKLDRFSLVGMSFGAWLALNFAIAAPEQLRRLVLLSPAACFLPLVKQFMVRAMLTRLSPKRFWFYSLMAWMGLKNASGDTDNRPLLDLMYLGGTQFRMSSETMRVMPTVLSDDELRGLRIPVLLLIGENEALYDAPEALARARRLIPVFEGGLVPGCSHDMSMSQYGIVDSRVLAFVSNA